MNKKWILTLIFIQFLAFFCYGVTWSVSTNAVSITNYNGTQLNSSVNLTISRDNGTGSASYYLLVAGATLDGNYQAGYRRTYKGSNTADSSLQVYIRPSSGTSEIGTQNVSGTVVASGSMTSGTKSKTIAIKFYTGTGKVPSGTYTNTFQFQLYTGSTSAGSGTLQSGAIGSVSASVTSSTSSTMSISLGTATCSFGSALVADQSYSTSTTMTVTAPSRFSISAKSANLGSLVNASGESFHYHFYFNGSATETILTAGLVRLIYSTTAVSSKSYALAFTTDTLGFLEPGVYSDNLTLMFTTQ